MIQKINQTKRGESKILENKMDELGMENVKREYKIREFYSEKSAEECHVGPTQHYPTEF